MPGTEKGCDTTTQAPTPPTTMSNTRKTSTMASGLRFLRRGVGDREYLFPKKGSSRGACRTSCVESVSGGGVKAGGMLERSCTFCTRGREYEGVYAGALWGVGRSRVGCSIELVSGLLGCYHCRCWPGGF